MSAPASSSNPALDLADRIVEQVRRLESHADPALRAPALELLQTVMELHALALARVLECAADADRAAAPAHGVTAALLADDIVRSVLLLHDLHPQPLPQRVAAALAAANREMPAGCRAELREIDANNVQVLVHPGAASNPERLRDQVERLLLDAAPDAALLVALAGGGAQLISIESLLRPAAAAQPNARTSQGGAA